MEKRTGHRHDATGRSSGRLRQFGRAKGWKFEEAFVCEPQSLLESPGYKRLSFPALKILTFLKTEHVRHGGAENGLLMAPHRQLQALGISPRSIKPALVMLEVFGIIRCTSDGSRLGGRPNAATYALTWLPTCDGELPTNDFRTVTREMVEDVLTERYFSERLAKQRKADAAPTSEGDPPTQVKATTPKTPRNAYTSEGGAALTREGTIYSLGGSAPLADKSTRKTLSEPERPRQGATRLRLAEKAA